MPSAPYDSLVSALRAAAQNLISDRAVEHRPDGGMGQILAAAVATVPGADVGGISITEHGVIDSPAVTHDDVRLLNELQTRLHEGPCFTALETPPPDGVIDAQDLTRAPDATRWPRYAAQAVEHGYRSLLSTELSLRGRHRVGMTLYAREPGVFDDTARTLAGLSAVQAALVVNGADRAAHLRRAVDSRDLIGQAKGILMERFMIDAEEAFRMLVRASQETNVRLVDVAHLLTEGALSVPRNSVRNPEKPGPRRSPDPN
ncbi:ANTAR domain-containing protein [Pseudonocardia sp. C8]|uniref:GAF and ANTAR domain-containing protein n=1 Tax=Pseudonocardia sp. C8 TaxID=2762759 RepID=UPI0016423F00|nr:GAF and ANTAR domain-containing protein [Pseudonocardia sp. C8]MBC3190954.1 ANTAR domain-containing protein [Pseudonocardia sp. C8]